ncbi:hypothetical protein [Mycobacterium sp. AZCC_0083]|uniref:hypothetical protein n=1 Tax=Mycobacterium sp. AZCC_0083 TaxID=2735882 RepID=UPI00160D012A|nr:hypothetical protein [Mycobacterium sp. AZCC_0083]MBB5167150.1 hypothetical protein [Mycobacterium sp. AZCC_0083]
MSAKVWLTADEWTRYVPCDGDREFTTAPEELVDGGDRVRSICRMCPVRPECIELNIKPMPDLRSIGRAPGQRVSLPSSSVWVAGEWLPDWVDDPSRDELATIKAKLESQLAQEYANRPASLL